MKNEYRVYLFLLTAQLALAQTQIHSDCEVSEPFLLDTFGSIRSGTVAESPSFLLNTWDIGTSSFDTLTSASFVLDTRFDTEPGGQLLARLGGCVTDTQTGLGVPGASVEVQPAGRCLTTDSEGNWSVDLSAGYDYLLEASAPGYQSTSCDGVDLFAGQTRQQDLYLQPLSGEYTLVEVAAGINPSVSRVEQSGSAVRHYRVLRGGQPCPYTTVDVPGLYACVEADEDGIVAITIPSWSIGSGAVGDMEEITISTVEGQPLTTPLSFYAQVEAREYERGWRSEQTGKLGASIVRTQVTNGALVTVLETGGPDNSGDRVHIQREARRSTGVEFSVGASVGVNAGPVTLGAGAEAGAGGNVTAISRDEYEFPLAAPSDMQVLAQYILVADGVHGSSDQVMVRVLGALEEIFTDQNTINQAMCGGGFGLGLAGHAQAEATAIAGSRQQRLGLVLAAGAGVGAGIEQFLYHDTLSELWIYSAGISGELSANAAAGVYFGQPGWSRNENLSLPGALGLEGSLSGSIGVQFSVLCEDLEPVALQMNLNRRWVLFTDFADSGSETGLCYTLSGLANEVEEIIELSDIAGSMHGNSTASISNSAPADDILLLLEETELRQTGGSSLELSYEKTQHEIDRVDHFEIGIELALTSALSIQVGGEVGFEGTHGAVVERGTVYGFHHYPQESYSSTPEVDLSYRDYLQNISDALPTWAKAAIATANVIDFLLPGRTDCHPVAENGSCIEISAEHLPDSLTSISVASWSWYGNEPAVLARDKAPAARSKLAALRSEREELLGMRYGIGGFYQFEPLGLELLADSAYFTIVYDNAECTGFDEAELAMYIENKANQDWIYLGGVVDTVANTLRAPISSLGCFTLAPRLSRGSFRVEASPDSLPADASALTQVSAGPVYNNDSTLVADGSLFTLSCDRGTIVAVDADSEREGLQLASQNGLLNFELRSGSIPFDATITVQAIRGTAQGICTVRFYNVDLPEQPLLLSATPEHESLLLSWREVASEDLAGYRIYFDSDSLAPHDGQASVWGTDSPVDVGAVSEHLLRGLSNDSTYCVALSAIDVAGAEGPLSNWLVASPELREVADLCITFKGESLQLDWSTLPNVAEYQVWSGECDQSFTEWELLSTVAGHSCILPVEENVSRCFRVVVVGH